ncbi:hypothetical protein [Luteolibacter soli]|uniref:DUF3592 domain-containing protein n=1 Tax=Luteolibacter soli TaxID=3135280 RepID=A0ABU9AVB4_9BACT
MPRPIHRWKSFWAGILILTFLSWAWWDSTHFWTTISHRHYYMSHVGSGICIADWAEESYSPSTLLFWEHRKLQPSQEPLTRVLFEAPETFRYQPGMIGYHRSIPWEPRGQSAGFQFGRVLSGAALGSRAIFLPHWLLILLFLIPWATFLLWRFHRIKRLKTTSES